MRNFRAWFSFLLHDAMFRITPGLYEKIKHYANFPQTGVSLRQMVLFGQKPSQGTLLKATQFLHEELPVRLAHRVKELDELPYGLSEMNSILKVKNWYGESFKELIELPPPQLSQDVKEKFKQASMTSKSLPESIPNPVMSEVKNGAAKAVVPLTHRYFTDIDDNNFHWPPEVTAYNAKFVKTIEAIKRRHDPVVTTIAQGILEFKKHKNSEMIGKDIQAFLDRFYMSRIGIRMLIGQHVALYRGPPRSNYVGIICTNTNIRETCQEAIENARFICEDYYGLFSAPEVQLICRDDLAMMYVPSHLSHMLFELLKNSLRAVVEIYGEEADSYPPIKVIVAEGKEDITIKVSDEGGGIPRSGIPLVWTYMYTTAKAQDLDPDFNKSEFKAPMAGFGYGLPISRLYARYFGGDLRLISMEGYGTDAYLHLNRLSNSDEPLN